MSKSLSQFYVGTVCVVTVLCSNSMQSRFAVIYGPTCNFNPTVPEYTTPLYIVTYYIKWVTTSWTCSGTYYCTSKKSRLLGHTVFVQESFPFYVATYFMKWVKTSLTDSRCTNYMSKKSWQFGLSMYMLKSWTRLLGLIVCVETVCPRNTGNLYIVHWKIGQDFLVRQ